MLGTVRYICLHHELGTCMVVSRLAALMLPSEWHVVVVSNCYSNKITRIKNVDMFNSSVFLKPLMALSASEQEGRHSWPIVLGGGGGRDHLSRRGLDGCCGNLLLMVAGWYTYSVWYTLYVWYSSIGAVQVLKNSLSFPENPSIVQCKA